MVAARFSGGATHTCTRRHVLAETGPTQARFHSRAPLVNGTRPWADVRGPSLHTTRRLTASLWLASFSMNEFTPSTSSFVPPYVCSFLNPSSVIARYTLISATQFVPVCSSVPFFSPARSARTRCVHCHSVETLFNSESKECHLVSKIC